MATLPKLELRMQAQDAPGFAAPPNMDSLSSQLKQDTDGDAAGAPTDVDWSSADQVCAHVSKSTLGGMQHLWRSHASSMDAAGREFAERMYRLHSSAMKDVATMKTFDLKPVLALLNNFTDLVRQVVLEVLQTMRTADDSFAQALYQCSRRAFSRTLREALEAQEAAHVEKVKRLRAEHTAALEAQRHAATLELAAQAAAHQQEVAKAIKEEGRKKLAQAMAAIKTSPQPAAGADVSTPLATARPRTSGVLTGALGGGLTSPGAIAGTPSTSGAAAALAIGSIGAATGGTISTSGAAAAPAGGGGGLSALTLPGGRTLSLDLLAALAGGGVGDDDDDDEGLEGGGTSRAAVMREVEAAIRGANEAVEELKGKVEELSLSLASERSETGAWKAKWAQENSKTDGIKRECMQIVIKCEQHLTGLQSEHAAELSKRDYMLLRCRETIVKLEARVAELTGQAAEQRLVSWDAAVTGGATSPGSAAALPPSIATAAAAAAAAATSGKLATPSPQPAAGATAAAGGGSASAGVPSSPRAGSTGGPFASRPGSQGAGLGGAGATSFSSSPPASTAMLNLQVLTFPGTTTNPPSSRGGSRGTSRQTTPCRSRPASRPRSLAGN